MKDLNVLVLRIPINVLFFIYRFVFLLYEIFENCRNHYNSFISNVCRGFLLLIKIEFLIIIITLETQYICI